MPVVPLQLRFCVRTLTPRPVFGKGPLVLTLIGFHCHLNEMEIMKGEGHGGDCRTVV